MYPGMEVRAGADFPPPRSCVLATIDTGLRADSVETRAPLLQTFKDACNACTTH